MNARISNTLQGSIATANGQKYFPAPRCDPPPVVEKNEKELEVKEDSPILKTTKRAAYSATGFEIICRSDLILNLNFRLDFPYRIESENENLKGYRI